MFTGPMTVVVPAERDALRVLRMMASDAGNLIGLTYDGIENVRLAVNEGASVLLADERVQAIECRFSAEGTELRMDLSAQPQPGEWPPATYHESLERLVLDRVTDHLDLTRNGRWVIRMTVGRPASRA